MSIETTVAKLGEIQPLEDKFYPLNEAEVAELEKEVGANLPDDYV